MTWRRGLFGLLMVVGVVAAATPARGQADKIYREGLNAVEGGDWVQVEALMRKAIAERPEARVRRRQTYIPYYYIGLARFRQGDCAGADEVWGQSESQGVVQGLAQARSIEHGRETCRLRADLAELLVAVRAELRQTSVSAASLLYQARREGTRDVWDEGSPSPADRHEEALALLSQSRELLADDAEVAAMHDAQRLIRDADSIFADLVAEVADLTSEWKQVLGSKRQGVAGLAIDARSIMATTTHLAPYPRSIRKARADLEGLLGEAERMRPDPSPEYLEGLAARLGNSINNLKGLTDGPPARLRRAAESFLAGQYDVVVDGLAEARLADSRSRAHAHMLLAASRYFLFLEGGEADRGLLESAAADVKACYAASSVLRPDSRIFSPRFVTFFEEQRGAG